MAFGKMIARLVEQNPQIFKRVTPSTPTPVDVTATGIAMQSKKNKTLKGSRGTGVTYSGVKTSSQGLLTGATTEKKTLLGG
jgi:hypothetical protein